MMKIGKIRLNFLEDFLYHVFLIYLVLSSSYSFQFKNLLLYGMALILLLLLIIKIVNERVKIDKDFQVLFVTIIIFLFSILISLLTSVNTSITLLHLLRYIFFFLIILSYFTWINSQNSIRLLKTFVIIGHVISFSIIYNIIFENAGLRQGGIISNSSNAAFIIYICGMANVFLFIKYRNKKYIYSTLFLAIMAISTLSRATLLCIITTAFVFCMYKIKNNNFTKGALGVLIVGICFLGIIALYKYEFILDKLLRLDRGTTGRTYLWTAGINIFKEYPFFGIGFGNIAVKLGDYTRQLGSGWEIEQLAMLNGSHSIYIDMLIQGGIFAGNSLVVMLSVLGMQIFRELRNNDYALSMLAILLSIIIRGFFEPAGFLYNYFAVDIFFWIFYIIFLKFR